jgi:hypothetical protein
MSRVTQSRRLPRGWRALVLSAIALAAGSGLVWPSAASAAVGVPTTYVDQTFASGVASPTQDKPQSKLWNHDGSWWALMVTSAGPVDVHELMPNHTWRDTGTVVDTRPTSTGDALWSSRNNQLWVVSRAPGSNAIVNRLSYNTATRSYTVNPGFPITLPTGGGSESAAIDQAADGKYWVTYTRASTVWVTHSTDDTGNSWVAPFRPPVPDTTLKADDISSIIGFGDSIGVMYSDQQSGAFRFATHKNADPDTTWQMETPASGLNTADDHINLKQLTGDSQGRVFAAVKTSLNDPTNPNPSDPLIQVLTRTPGANGAGTWALATAGTVADDFTRPMIMIDATNNVLYLFATAPVNGGDIYYKSAPLSNISFPSGRGAKFVDASFVINNATGAKDPVTAATGLVVVASSTTQLRYVHAEMQLPGSTGGDTTAPTVTGTVPAANSSTAAVSGNVTATFSEAVQGVSNTTFTLKNTATGTAVPAAVSQNGTTNQWILNPNADLAAGTQYTATLTGGTTAIRDAANNPLATTSWSFTTAGGTGGGTGDTTAPTVTAQSPANNATGVGPSPNVLATFSEPVQGVSGSTFTLKNNKTGAAVAATVSQSTTNANQWILNPTLNFSADTSYTATLTGGATGIRDMAGNPLTGVSWTFLTGAVPTVTARTPAVNATGVSRTAPAVTATFSEAVKNVTGTTFTLRAGTAAPITATVVQNGTTNQWRLTPGTTLAANTQYTVTITGGASGVTDLAGNPLTTVTWRFTTGA